MKEEIETQTTGALLLAAFRRVSELDAEWIEAFLSLSLRGLEEGAEPFSAQNPQNLRS